MADIFAITTAAEDNIKVNESGSTIIMFTATNKSGNPVRGVAKIKPIDNTQSDWLTIEGETERDFSANGTQQFTVNFNKSASGETQEEEQSFPFRLDVVSSANPDEDFTEGPTVTVEIDGKKAEEKKPFPIWIPIVAGVLLLAIIGSVVGYLLLRDSSIKVPDVVGKTVEEAKTELEGLELTVKEEYKRASVAESGKVLGQDPPKDTEVEAGATITLTVPLKKIVLPNLVDKKISDAENELKALGLISETVYVKASGKMDDIVFDQSPSDGSEVEPESIVKLSVPLKKVKVPNVLGFTFKDAKAELEENGLKVQQLYKSAPTKKIDAVFDQNPKRPAEVESGTVVKLYFPIKRVEVPNLNNMTFNAAKVDLEELGLKVKRYDGVKTGATIGRVYFQSPVHKTELETGNTVSIYIAKKAPNNYRISLNCKRPGLANTHTSNRITVSFHDASDKLIKAIPKNGITNCNSASSFYLTTEETVKYVYFKTNGQDAFYILNWKFYLKNDVKKSSGPIGNKGWCLSTDSKDKFMFGPTRLDMGCKVFWKFPV